MTVHEVNVRHREIHTAEPLEPEPSAFEGEMATEKLKTHKSPGTDHIPAKSINLLKPTGDVMHQQFNNQQLYALSALYLCFVFILHHELTGFGNRVEKCLQPGTDWVFK
jgi:hypothetical protein